MLYDENKLCLSLKVISIKCDFILHETCLKSRRQIHHALHPHLLTLKAVNRYDGYAFRCRACDRDSVAFVYQQCHKRKCGYHLDVRCHYHALFLSLSPEEKPICEVCKLVCNRQLNCIECNFIVCFKCATLPFKARYKHNKHFLTLLWGEDVCEVCQLNLKATGTKLFYWCNDCCTTLHVACLFGETPYLKPDQSFESIWEKVEKANATCKKRCQDKRQPHSVLH